MGRDWADGRWRISASSGIPWHRLSGGHSGDGWILGGATLHSDGLSTGLLFALSRIREVLSTVGSGALSEPAAGKSLVGGMGDVTGVSRHYGTCSGITHCCRAWRQPCGLQWQRPRSATQAPGGARHHRPEGGGQLRHRGRPRSVAACRRCRRGDCSDCRHGRLEDVEERRLGNGRPRADRKSTRLNSSHMSISYAVFCLKKKKNKKKTINYIKRNV